MRKNKLAVVGIWMCFTLTSCSRWVVKANVESVPSVPVHIAQAVVQDVPLDVAAVGTVESIDSVEVKSRIAGQIESVAFTEGQNLVKGQLLFAIDSSALQRQEAEEHAELERDTAMEQQARSVVARDMASFKQNQADASVEQKLAKIGVVAQQRADQLVTASETAGAALRSDQAAVDAAVGTLNADRARLAQTQLQISFSKVVAPISGRAGAVTLKAGSMVRDNDTTLVTLLQLNPIHVTFGIPEQVLSEVQRLNKTGPLLVGANDGQGHTQQGRLDFIDNAVDATTGAIRLKATFPNADSALWPGQFVHVSLCLRIEKGRIVVPQSAVQDGLDGKYVWLVKQGIANIAPVTVLRSYKVDNGPEQAILASGIKPGDSVVTSGQLKLTPGAPVERLDALSGSQN
jgi:multidrug efflux system membrane fusion protein